jgi:flagellar motor component MotA
MNKNLDDKLDRIQDDVNEIKTHLAVYNQQLVIHIKRSETLEEKLELDMEKMNQEIKPLISHVSMVQGAFWILGVLGAVLLGLQQLGLLDIFKS